MAQTVVEAHAAYYYGVVREAERQIWGAHIANAVSRLEAETDNLRAALTYYLTAPAYSGVSGKFEAISMKLANALLACPSGDQSPGRDAIVSDLRNEIKVYTMRNASAQLDIYNIVNYVRQLYERP